ncbi:MAG TPA: ATP-binding protein [Cytophagales bacterium]|nr:ATP-binding protein [Cytophagales bacterium]
MNSTKQSFWIPLLVFLVIHIGSHVSILAQHDLSVSDYYLPTAFSVVFILWFGPKNILPVMYINAVGTSYLWGNPVEQWPLWFLYAIPETLFTFFAWFLFKKVYDGKYWLPDIRNTVLFLVLGVFIPAIIETFSLQSMLVWTGAQSPYTYWKYIVSNLLSEFTTSFFITLPALYFLSPWLKRKKLVYYFQEEVLAPQLARRAVLLEMSGVFLCLSVLVFLVEFREFWFIYGFFSLYVAIRFGFGPAILTNFYILIIIYVLPKIFAGFGENEVGGYQDVINIFFGACLLFVFAAITGRVISDVMIADEKLIRQNSELEKTNEELDRFVYSVSHDLSAPLKSILGLVNISKVSTDIGEHYNYLNWIERSVKKLELFISEVLDYSRNNRQQSVSENISLEDLCNEIIENLNEMSETKPIQFHFNFLEPEICQDKTRLKIILNNLLSNAIKFQKSSPGHKPYVKISSFRNGDELQIEVEDNGEGIRSEQLEKIFQMFYRGHEKASGSGLGLYIAKEATSKINGSISVRSEYGKGSTFVISFKDLK